MRPPGREPTICRLIDNRANHYATNPLQVWKTISYIKEMVYR